MDKVYLLYVQEVTDFLDDVVIKFSPFVNIFNENPTYLAVPGYDEYNPKTYPYYRILAGDAAFATTDIYAYSPLLRQEILLTRENVTTYPDIAVFYRIPSNLKLLLNRYPNDKFIIRRILNPVKDIDKAINASNLTILETIYTDQFLNQYERSSILIFLQDILWKIDYRWYMSPLEYEDLYPYAFWAMLWSLLPLIVLTKRILNIKTSDVHPFHIWEYLTSLGFGRYKGYLSHEQELFLYRNALYLKFHAGKKFILDILESVFLTPLKYSLTKKTIISHTLGREETHDKVPDVIPTAGSVDEFLSSTTFDNFLQNIYDANCDIRNDDQYRQDISNRFSISPVNKLNTKFLELDRNIDMSEMTLVLRFILDEIIYLISKNKLQYAVDVQSPLSQTILRFDSVLDTLTFLFYCIYSCTEIPTVPFNKYSLTTALIHLQEPSFPTTVFVDGQIHYIKSYVDLDTIKAGIPFINEEFYTSRDLSTSLGILYTWLFDMINKLANISDTVTHESHVAVFRTLIPNETTVLINQPYATYTEFFEHYPNALNELSKIYESNQCSEFVYTIINSICPLEYGFASLARDDEVVSVLISKIKELFTYMVSYNITFLNQVFEQSTNLTIPKLTMHITEGVEGSGIGALPGGETNHNFTDIIYSLFHIDDGEIDTMNYYVSISETSEDEIILDNIDLELTCTPTTSYDFVQAEQIGSSVDVGSEISYSTIFIVNEGIQLEFIETI